LTKVDNAIKSAKEKLEERRSTVVREDEELMAGTLQQ
jgi:hypothetical protein